MLLDTMIEDGYFPTLESSKLLVCGLLNEENIEKLFFVECFVVGITSMK